MFSNAQIELCNIISKLAEDEGISVFLVGGIVRDIALGEGKLDKDVDFVIEGNAINFAGKLNLLLQGDLATFPGFYTAKIVNPQKLSGIHEVDVASARTEIYQKPGKMPKVQLALIGDDLRRRDFSINAMAIKLSDNLINFNHSALDQITYIDHFNGISDLNSKIIRVLHEESFIDDPSRIYRAYRYRVRLGGLFDSETERYMQKALEMGAFKTISNGRHVKELEKIRLEKDAQTIFKLMQDEGILEFAPRSEIISNFFSKII